MADQIEKPHATEMRMQHGEGEADMAGPHLDYVNVFNANGVTIQRPISQGKLHAPVAWT